MKQNPEEKTSNNSEELVEGSPEREHKKLRERDAELAYEKQKKRENWFVAIIVLIIFLDVGFFSFMPSFGGPLVIGVLQIFVLIILAKRMGMKEMAKILSHFISRVPKDSSSNGD